MRCSEIVDGCSGFVDEIAELSIYILGGIRYNQIVAAKKGIVPAKPESAAQNKKILTKERKEPRNEKNLSTRSRYDDDHRNVRWLRSGSKD